MDWHVNLRTFVSRPETSFNFLYNYNYEHCNPGMDMKLAAMAETQNGLIPNMEKINYGGHQEKKKRLTNEQLDSLERSFEEEIKLDPDRKMKLSRELGLQPRQIAVWFQNRRARWKAKQLERLYDSLKQEFDVVSKEKQILQQEVMKLKTILRQEQASRKQVPAPFTEVSGEETLESTSVAVRSISGKPLSHQNQQITECNYLLNVDEYNNINAAVSSPYWAVIPSYP